MAKRKPCWFKGPKVPKITAPMGTDEWYAQIRAYNAWLDAEYAKTKEAPEADDEE